MSTNEPIFAVYNKQQFVSDPRSHSKELQYPCLKSDVIVADADLELLLSNDVLFWPVRVILSLGVAEIGIRTGALSGLRTL